MNLTSLTHAPILHWLSVQISVVMHTVTAVIGNTSQPARTTLIYTVVLIFVLLAFLKIGKKASK